MNRDPLRTLLRLRTAALDAARQALADGLTAERRAIDGEHAAREALRFEEAAATSLDAGDGAVEAFAAWLPRGREAVRIATAERDRCAAELVGARAKLALARAGAEAITSVLDSRASGARAAESRKAQAELDEAGRDVQWPREPLCAETGADPGGTSCALR